RVWRLDSRRGSGLLQATTSDSESPAKDQQGTKYSACAHSAKCPFWCSAEHYALRRLTWLRIRFSFVRQRGVSEHTFTPDLGRKKDGEQLVEPVQEDRGEQSCLGIRGHLAFAVQRIVDRAGRRGRDDVREARTSSTRRISPVRTRLRRGPPGSL